MGWWYRVGGGVGTALCFVKYMHARRSTGGVSGAGGGCRFRHSAHVGVRE